MLKDFKKLIAGLKYWNIYLSEPNITKNYESRLILQKLAYFCQSLDIPLKYKFILYVNGPYSSALADDYYKYPIMVSDLTSDYEPTLDEKNIFKKIKDIVLSHPLNQDYRAELLEAVSTVLYLWDNSPKLLDDDVYIKTRAKKPYLREKTILIAINLAKKLRFKEEYLTKEIKNELELWDNAED